MENTIDLINTVSEFNDIHEFLSLESEGYYDTFILSEYTDKVSVFMTEENKNHLFDLDYPYLYFIKKNKIKKFFSILKLIFFYFELSQ